IVRSAALASIVDASMPIRLPLTRPCSATSFNTQLKTVSWISRGSRPRVFDNHERSGTFSRFSRRRKSRSDIESEQRQADAALTGDSLEITDHVHAEVTPRRHRRGDRPPAKWSTLSL